ncbi:MAG: thiamine diphosphokinase [Clostridia bacterium]|nr:thiamine diphosphokinase [Clostridia bacterium]
MKCVIFGSAPINSYDFINKYLDKSDFIICADGGIAHTEKLGITPQLIIGDFDSYSGKLPSDNVMRYPSEKDDTDMALCIEYAIKNGYEEIIIAGGLGGRIDHTLANLSLLAKYSDKSIMLIDEKTEITAISDFCSLEKNEKKYISFVSFTEKTEGVTYKGLKYPLSDATLYSKDAQFSISNEIIEKKAEISLKSGILLCIRTED